jgi:hypothetical protein
MRLRHRDISRRGKRCVLDEEEYGRRIVAAGSVHAHRLEPVAFGGAHDLVE